VEIDFQPVDQGIIVYGQFLQQGQILLSR
jgi:hypothetical protein